MRLINFSLLYLITTAFHGSILGALIAIPEYVVTYAPLVYLDQNELYLPSDIQSQFGNTTPFLNYTALPASSVPNPLNISNLDQLNADGNCTDFTHCPLYLTSKENPITNPPWLYGVLPDPVSYETVGAKSCAVIVYDHGNGIVDAFYHYFYAFNLGLTVFGEIFGNHVGDWEHSVVRFQNATPVSVWLSQHDYGQAFTYNSLSKIGSRPIIYSAIGSHANFAVPGTHSRLIESVAVNDTTSQGPLWDPVTSAYFYTYSPSSPSLYTAVNGTISERWLYYYGQWGDEQYPDSDPRQVNLLNLNITWKWESGPTGPGDKGLVRSDVCPNVAATPCVTLSELPAVSGSSIPVTVVRTRTSTSATSIPSTSSTSSSAAASATAKSGSSGKHQMSFGIMSLCLASSLIVIR